jgi:predicted DCC family thiol-disulfide oxidoreductase YuxK
MNNPTTYQNPIILFDGVCNLCNSTVQFVIKNDTKKIFRFASLQSSFGQNILQQHQLNTKELSSLVVLEKDFIYTKSTGALHIAQKLKFPFNLLYGLIIVPPFIRNAVYKFVAKNRYKWFGKTETCWVPTPELKTLFLD